MYYSPHTHMDISRQRHEDMLREARNHELARLVEDDRPGLVARFRKHLPSLSERRQPAVRPV
jgi:hypothetical protein